MLKFKIQTLLCFEHSTFTSQAVAQTSCESEGLCMSAVSLDLLVRKHLCKKTQSKLSDWGFTRRTFYLQPSPPGVDARGGEQEAAQAAVGVTFVFALRAAVWKWLDDLHKGLWENSGLVIYCAL